MPRGDGETSDKIYGHGFDPQTCEGCPYQQYFKKGEGGVVQRVANAVAGDEEGYYGCGICGCPTEEGLLLDQFQAPPEGCIRLAQHRRRASDTGSDQTWG